MRGLSLSWALFFGFVFPNPILAFLLHLSTCTRLTHFCPTGNFAKGFWEGCKSNWSLFSSQDGLYLSHGLPIFSHLFPSNWELSLSFSVYPTLSLSNRTVPFRGGRWAWVFLSFWPKVTLKIYSVKLELFLFQHEQCIYIFFHFFLFISDNFGDGVSVKWFSNHHIFWKIWHFLYSTMLRDYKYTLHSQHDILLLKRFSMTVFTEMAYFFFFFGQIHYWICVSERVEQQQTEDPVPGCQKILQSLPLPLPQVLMLSCQGRSQYECLLTSQWDQVFRR